LEVCLMNTLVKNFTYSLDANYYTTLAVQACPDQSVQQTCKIIVPHLSGHFTPIALSPVKTGWLCTDTNKIVSGWGLLTSIQCLLKGYGPNAFGPVAYQTFNATIPLSVGMNDVSVRLRFANHSPRQHLCPNMALRRRPSNPQDALTLGRR